MRFNRSRPWCAVSLLALSLLLTLACARYEGDAVVEESSAVETDVAAVETALAAADAVDGQTDKVVSRCPACSLGMDGSAEHSVEAHGYELHFCSEGCKKDFAEDLDTAILAMKVPEN